MLTGCRSVRALSQVRAGRKNGVWWLNPGSCGPRRFHQEITMMMAEITDGQIRVEKINIPHEVK